MGHTPLGIPIKRQLPSLDKVFRKEGSIVYKIHEKVSPDFDEKQCSSISSSSSSNHHEFIIGDRTEKFITDGFFCSFNCALAFINDHIGDPIYEKSESLLKLMYIKLFDREPTNLIPAPHWRMLKCHGGPLSETEYLNTFNRILFADRGHIHFSPIGFMYEEDISMRR